MTGRARIATDTDAAEVGRILAAGFAEGPVLTWVFQEPGRASKLASFFQFLGSHLARMELRVALEEWIKHYPNFELAKAGQVTWSAGQVRSPGSVPVQILGGN